MSIWSYTALILRNVWVHRGRPGIDTAAQVEDVLEAKPLQIVDGLSAAAAHVAHHHIFGLLVESARPLQDIAQRLKLRAFDAAKGILIGLAHIDEHGRVGRSQAPR